MEVAAPAWHLRSRRAPVTRATTPIASTHFPPFPLEPHTLSSAPRHQLTYPFSRPSLTASRKFGEKLAEAVAVVRTSFRPPRYGLPVTAYPLRQPAYGSPAAAASLPAAPLRQAGYGRRVTAVRLRQRRKEVLERALRRRAQPASHFGQRRRGGGAFVSRQVEKAEQ